MLHSRPRGNPMAIHRVLRTRLGFGRRLISDEAAGSLRVVLSPDVGVRSRFRYLPGIDCEEIQG